MEQEKNTISLALPKRTEVETRFAGIRAKLADYKKEIKDIVVDSPENLEMLRLKLKTLKEFKEDVEEQKLAYTKPLRDHVAMANEIVKFVLDDTDLVITDGKNKMTNYQLVVQREEEERQKKLREEAEAKRKQVETAGTEEKLLKIRLLDHAKETLLKVANATTYPELDAVFTETYRKYPWPDFASVAESAEKVKKIIKDACSSRKAFVSSENPSDAEIEESKKTLEQIRRTVQGIQKKRDELDTKVEEVIQTATDIAEIQGAIKASEVRGKGTLRMTWTFELTDLSKVPLEYLQLNETRVKQFIAKNLQGTKRTEDDTESIPGVRMFKKASSIL